MDNNFFAQQTRSSRIKSNIVSEYFPKYCRIILKKPQTQIRYLDLFAGPGIYEDGALSTPILVGKACSSDAQLSSSVQLLFNDNKYCERLKNNFNSHFPNGTFAYEPAFGDKTVGEDEELNDYLMKKVTTLDGKNPHPTLLFIDPFGYKAVQTKVLAEFMQNWGNEMFLFVNTKRIHAAIENEKFDELMLDLFPTTINDVRNDRKYKLRVEDRLNLIIENLAKEYQKIISDTLFYTAFRFQEEDSTATSHYILHFTKHSRGYDLVKQIYHDFDNIGTTLEKDGTYTFDAKKLDMESNNLFDFGDQNVNDLSRLLVIAYKGKTITASRLFEEHQTSFKYSRRHYVGALRKLVTDEEITAKFTDEIEHKVSVLLNDSCVLQFK